MTSFSTDEASEIGENYVKFANGLLICWGFINLNGMFTMNGGIGISTHSNLNIFYPRTFVSVPIVAANVTGNSAALFRLQKDSEKITNIVLFAQGSYSFATTVNYVAIGRWK